MSTIALVESSAAADRLAAAGRFVAGFPPATEILIAAASRQAADDFVRELAVRNTATFGLRRFSLFQLAAFIAAVDLARRGLVPASALGIEAIATRATFDARRDNALAYMAPIADRPGFPAALAETIADLRGAGIDARALGGEIRPKPDPTPRVSHRGPRVPAVDACLRDLSHLLARFDEHLDSCHIADPVVVLGVAAAAVRGGSAVARAPLVLLDVGIENGAVADFVSALLDSCRAAIVTVPAHDLRTLGWLATRRDVARASPSAGPAPGPLARVQRYLFDLDLPGDLPADAAPVPEVDLFSAPGEGREATEIARRVLAEAKLGTPFDRMAVLVRAPLLYGGLLETAFRRAGIPAWFARGTKRPDPSGRAFLALLRCALERLSARRFAEYLSLGEVPDPTIEPGGRPDTSHWVPADAEALCEPAAIREDAAGEPRVPVRADDDSDTRAVVSGTLRAPWRWEDLLVDAAVVGSHERWERRLQGLANDLERRVIEVESDDPDSPRADGLRRDLRNLGHLRAFAIPVIGRLSRLPGRARWGEWLDDLEALAPQVLRRPERVLAVLAELRPMSQVGPVTLEEVHRVLSAHLSQLRQEPRAHRYGAVLVATPDQVRGRAFDVVFVPGLAERVFPQRAREDPLLVDDRRRQLGAGLPLRDDMAQQERLLLRIAVGAASARLCLSYPSMDLAQARARVPSFYALDVERARTGRVPDFEVLAERAQRSSGARLAWPAPRDESAAIDDGERDLAVLARLLQLQQRDRAAARGRARFLLSLNPHLARALRARWARAQRQWSAADGLYHAGAAARAALAAHRLRARPYSVSALQRFAACPYQFLLGAIHRLEPRSEIAWLDQMDPLQRGEIFHRVQAETVRWLLQRDLRGERVHDEALAALDRVLNSVAAAYYEDLAPAIDRVWHGEIESMRTDLRGWLQRLLEQAADWQPRHAELGFGFGPGEGRDPGSVAAPVTLEGGWQLHGIADLVERRVSGGGSLRVTDHKTGRARTAEDVIVGGGEALQPVLYGMALEIALGRPVEAGRLFYCTLAGRYEERTVALDARARHAAVEVLQIVDRAVEQGSLPPAPREGACAYCDFRVVCGPDEERRIARKDPRPLADVVYLRGLR